MARKVAENVFVDTNVLVYAAVSSAPSHQAARATLQALRDKGRNLWISRQVIREYLAVLSRPQAFSQPIPWSTLADDARHFERSFHVADEDAAVTLALLSIAKQVPVGGRQVHDANIVATMVARGLEQLLTHNVRDFERFSPWVSVLEI